MKPERREFIPAIREHICKAVPLHEDATNQAIDKWRDGEDADSPMEQGVFGVCDKIAADLDSQDE